VTAIRVGDEQVYSTLFRELYLPLREFAATYAGNAALADEIVQEVFLDLWIRRAKWSPRFGVRAYLFRAVRNRATDTLRHARTEHDATRQTMGDDHGLPAGMGEAPVAPGADADLQEFAAALRDVLRTLPPARYRAAMLRWRHGLSYVEIAQTLHTSVASATMHVARAREAVRPVVERFTAE
jgi:RNA polymerase sigma-70 factor (ECF subfamily)